MPTRTRSDGGCWVVRSCEVDGCTKIVRARGWCGAHYEMWRRHGEPTAGTRHYASPGEALAARSERVGDCLVWTGSTDTSGYGRIIVNGRARGVHRYAWEQEHGPVPNGMEVDHTCWNRACFNRDHLRLLTPAQNKQNLKGARAGSAVGLRNVTRSGDRFQSCITYRRKRYYLGLHDTAEQAHAAAAAKRRELDALYEEADRKGQLAELVSAE